MANIGDVNDTEFQTSVLDSETPVLDFWAEWCVPCHMVSPVVEEIGQEKGQNLKVAKLNIDEPGRHQNLRGHVDPLLDPLQGREGGRAGHRRAAEGRDPWTSTRTSRRRSAPPHWVGVAAAPRTHAHSDRCASFKGDSGPEVADIQSRLTALRAEIDGEELVGVFGSSTAAAVRWFQHDRHLQVDGLVGPDTWEQLVEAGWRLGDRTLYHRAPMYRGDDVREIQRMLNALGFDSGKEDGFYGPRTDGALRLFQRNVGDEPDGIVGPHAVGAAADAPAGGGPVAPSCGSARSWMPPEGRSRRIIAIDVGEGVAAAGELHQRSALALVEELRAVGADPRLLVTGGAGGAVGPRPSRERGRRSGVHRGAHRQGRGRWRRPCLLVFRQPDHPFAVGLVLAQLILEELEAELGLSGRVRPLTIAPLRETQMPAVQVEPFTGAGRREDELLRDLDLPGASPRVAVGWAASSRLAGATCEHRENHAEDEDEHGRTQPRVPVPMGTGRCHPSFESRSEV